MIQTLTDLQKRKLAQLLLACPAVQDKGSRESLLQQLPQNIASAIKSHDAANTHVLNVVNTCADYPDGLEYLLEALRFFDDETHQFNAVIDFLEGENAAPAQAEPAQPLRSSSRVPRAAGAVGFEQQEQHVDTQYNAGKKINVRNIKGVAAVGKADGDAFGGNKTVISGISPKEFQALSVELGVTQLALKNFFKIVGKKGAVPLEDLDSELREVGKRYKEFLSRDLKLIMARSNLSDKIKARDEFTHHSEESRLLIKKAQRKLRHLPSHPDYLKVMIMGGTVLSSAGNLKEAKKLLIKAENISRTEEEKGLICFNLFQINLRCRDYNKALENLQAAIKVNPGRYALHDVKKYPIDRLLGAGGMGCVFLCFHPLKKKKVAVKCLWEKREDADKEASIMEKAAGKYVPEIIDYDYSDSGRAYFVTEYVEGAIDGAAWLKKHGKLSLEEGLEAGVQIAEALQSAHEKNIHHLDLKPANVLLKRINGRITIKLIDFGLSKVANSLQEEALTRQTQLGLSVFGQGIMGTLEYAPPEQLGYAKEYGEPDAKSDVFSFGTTLYHLLTGQSPRFPSPRKLPDLPEFQELLFDCVELIPQERPDIREIRLRLGRLAASVTKKEEEEAPEPTRKEVKRTKPEAVKPPAEEIKAGEVFRDPLQDGSESPEMIPILGGAFRMGNIQGVGESDERPVHEVALDGFDIGKYPVTVGEFRRFIEASAYRTEAEAGDGAWVAFGKRKDANWRNPYFKQNDDHPAVCISWNDAAAYCDWLRQRTGEEYRLPTEAEWEYACRAGSEAAYCFGDDEKRLGDYAWHLENAERKTYPVGEKKPNAWGLYDMHGNAWEWVQDWFGVYPEEAQKNPTGPETGSGRVIRGGGWYDSPRLVRSAGRFRYGPGIRNVYLGFRLARTHPQPFYPFTPGEKPRADPEVGGGWKQKPSAVARVSDRQGNGPALKKRLRKPLSIVVLLSLLALLAGLLAPLIDNRREDDLPVNVRESVPAEPEIKEPEQFRDTLKDGTQGPEMLLMPEGAFRMGEIQGGNSAEKPVHDVTLGKFFIGRYEVKRGEFEQFAEAEKYVTEAEKEKGCVAYKDGIWKWHKKLNWRNPGFKQTAEHPVVCVNWNDAAAYIAWLNKVSGEEYRLPTEAEWEYVARAGTETAYWQGQETSHEYANYGKDECCAPFVQGKDRWKYSAPAGSFAANPFGVHDTSGNVSEWVQDWYGDYSEEAQSNPNGPDTGSLRVVRGGGWADTARNCRSAVRSGGGPGYRDDFLGFRLARTYP
ncbi:MAG: SUMF1/EgtB/PvdO family nonheme iron enzyme [Gammaproteobacteria bacterium]|nr:SUMF1/EgtB/PvdO family nonheme iron enzyme [Gammaproteobacteria bacterium]